MGHRHHRAGELGQIVLQDGERLHVQIVGGLVQQQDVGRAHQDAQQIQPAPLAAGQPSDGGELEVGREQEPLHHLRGGHTALPGAQLGGDFVDVVVGALIGIQLPALLGEVADAHRAAEVDAAGVGRQRAGDQVQQRALARAVSADDAHAVVPQDCVGKIADDGFVPEGLGDVLQLHRLAPQPGGARRDGQALVGAGALLGLQRLIAGDALGALGGPGAAAAHDPLGLLAQKRLPLALAGLGHLQPLGLQLEVFGIVCLV